MGVGEWAGGERVLEVPDTYVDMCSHISDTNRKLHCAMTAAMDEGGVVGEGGVCGGVCGGGGVV